MFGCLPSLVQFMCWDSESTNPTKDLQRGPARTQTGLPFTASKLKCLYSPAHKPSPNITITIQLPEFYCCVFSFFLFYSVCALCSLKLNLPWLSLLLFHSHSAHFVVLFVRCGMSALVFSVVWRSLPIAEQTQPKSRRSVLFAEPITFQQAFARHLLLWQPNVGI